VKIEIKLRDKKEERDPRGERGNKLEDQVDG
jgi:hypothetical protein